MLPHQNRVVRKRDVNIPFSGSVTVSDPSPTGSSLAQNTAAVSDPNSSQTGIPLLATIPVASSAAATQSSTAPTALPSSSVSSSSSSGSQISLGTVIGACIAALIALLLAVLLAFYYSKRQRQSTIYSKYRNTANNASRRRSHLEPWRRMNDDADRREGQERSMTQRPASGTLGAMFHRTISNTSGEKSSEMHNRESVGTMQHFAKYHPGLAAEMASQCTAAGAKANIVQPPPVLHLMGRGSEMNPPISWDGETVGAESFMSLHSSSASSTPPFMMATAKATPPATASSPHRWESAEVVQVNSELPEDAGLPNPFADGASSIKSKRSSTKGRNPFFSGRDQPARRPALPDTPRNPFADPETPRDSDAAIQSLIAALQEPVASDRIISMQSSVYSRFTADDGESAVSVTAFPYPPTQLNVG